MLAGTIAMLLTAAQSATAETPSRRTTAADDPNRMICRAPEPVLGSRVARRRVCRTAAQWREHEVNRQAMQRDIQNTQSVVATDF